MTSFPRAPRLLKGAIVAIERLSPIPSVIMFQYNPDTVTRRLAASAPQGRGGGARVEALRLQGPPRETITMDAEIDAADQLERGDPLAATVGLHPTLAALETLLYPRSSVMLANDVLARLGVLTVVPPEAPLTLLVWGVPRVVPVRLTELTITEEAFDALLNPIRAKVSLSLTVLTYQDLGVLSPGGSVFLAHQVAKEVLARVGGLASAVSGAASISVGVRI